MRTRSLLVVLLLLLIPGVLFAGTTGKIKGKVTDRTTGEPLVGVNVIIEGTTLGAATDSKGEFFIINIPPGTYTVQLSYISYRTQSVEQVRVIADYTTPLDISLSQQAITGEEVVITAEKEIIKRDMTATATFHSKEEIINMPVNSFTEVMNTTAGFIVTNNGGDDGIHLRGGRTGEVGYYVDGFYMEDALYGGQGGDVPRLGIQDLSIITGTFNAEYGQAMSGIVNIVTPEGGNNYTGQFRGGTDQLVDHFDWGSSRVEGALSGPVPFFGNKMTFFVSADHSEEDGYLSQNTFYSAERDQTFSMPMDLYDNRTRITENLVIKPLENTKISIGGNHFRTKAKVFDYSYFAYPEGIGRDIRESDMAKITWTQTLSKSTFFNVKANWFQRRSYDGLYEDWDPNNVNDLAKIRRNLTGYFSEGSVIAQEFPAFLESNYEFNAPYALNPSAPADEQIMVYPNSTFWQDYQITEQNFMFDISSQIHPEHLIKFGAEYRSFEIKNHWIQGINEYAAWNQDTYAYESQPDDPIHYEIAKYTFKPKQASLYLQDKMEFENMIVNVGLRMDYLDVNAQGLTDPNELQNLPNPAYEDVDAQFKFSPRLGFGYPITDQAVLHFAYGRFIQFPEFQFLYRRHNENLPYPNLNQGYEPRIGNPSLEPEKTTSYELGANFLISDDVAIDLTVYYKDVYDFISSQRIDIQPTAYTAIVNMDYGNTKGIELQINKRFSNHWALRAAYTYSRAEGNADNWTTHFNELYNASVTGLVPPKSTNTLAWDQPHTLNFTLDYRYPDNWGVNVIGFFGSGLPYTPTDARGKYTGKANSGRMPWTGNVDVRFNKDFKVFGLKYQLWADVNNLLNKTNIHNVFNNSGRPDYSTNPNASETFQYRPHWYDAPRHLELGMTIMF